MPWCHFVLIHFTLIHIWIHFCLLFSESCFLLFFVFSFFLCYIPKKKTVSCIAMDNGLQQMCMYLWTCWSTYTVHWIPKKCNFSRFAWMKNYSILENSLVSLTKMKETKPERILLCSDSSCTFHNQLTNDHLHEYVSGFGRPFKIATVRFEHAYLKAM